MTKPPCPHCGSEHVVSNGAIRWLCGNCGRSWRKIKTVRAMPDYSKRPPCPSCGAYRGKKHGIGEYLCLNCGRVYQANWQEKQAARNLAQEDVVVAADSEAISL